MIAYSTRIFFKIDTKVFFLCFKELLNKSEDGLVMNQGDVYRQTQEQRYLVDRTIPFVDYGKGCKNETQLKFRLFVPLSK